MDRLILKKFLKLNPATKEKIARAGIKFKKSNRQTKATKIRAIAKIKLAWNCFLKTVGTKSKNRATTGNN